MIRGIVDQPTNLQ
jgi:hypothetical protein